MIVLWSIVIVIVLFTLFHYSTNARKFWKLRSVPYREPCPLFGNFGKTFTAQQSYAATLKSIYKQFAKEPFVGVFQARRPTLMLRDPELIKTILVRDFQHFMNRSAANTDTKREPLLRNLTTMSGEEWKAMRCIVTPTFSLAKLKLFFPLVLECANRLKTVIKDASHGEIDTDVSDLTTRYCTDVIGSCAFGVDPQALIDPDSPFLKMAVLSSGITKGSIIKRYMRIYFPFLFKFLNLKTYSKHVEQFFTEIMKQVITERRSTGTTRNDFLQILLNVQNESKSLQMTDELITSNVFTVLLAGLDTTSSAMSFLFYELARHPEVQKRIREEILDALRKHRELSYEVIVNMKYATHAVHESMRLHPPVPLTTRACTKDYQVPGTGIHLKPGETVLVPIQTIQRDAQYYPEPNKFIPERFEGDTSKVFLTFGEGPRSCIGGRFAQIIILTALATILTAYNLEPGPKTSEKLEYDPRSVILRNIGGMWIKFIPLHSKSD